MRALRKARLGQVMLAIASLLIVTGSLGLHPEPPTMTVVADAEGMAVCHGPQVSDHAAHECLACLAHRSLAIAHLSGFVLEPGIVVTPALVPRPDRSSQAVARTHEGRAPPALA